jgi:tetratricopeptide (TPR) repeat protein
MSVRGELHLNGNSVGVAAGYLTDVDEGGVIKLESPRFTIGRGPENSLCIPASVVSRSHAEVIRIGNDYLLRDLGSTNGSYVNGARISEQILNDGDVLRFGNNGPEAVFKLVEKETGEIIDLQPQPRSATENLIDALSGKLEILQDDVCEEANLRRVLAEAHLNKGEHHRALEVLTKYNDTTNLIALPVTFRATVLLWVGRVYLECKQLDLAIDALQRSLNFFNQASDGKDDESGVADAQSSLGRALINSGDLLGARDQLHRAMLAARRAGNGRLRAEVHYLLGKVDWKEGDFEGARYNWGRAARMAEETNDPLLRARVQLQQALVLYTEGKLKEAVPAYQSAIQQIEATGNVRLLLKGYSSLSRALMRLGSWTAVEKLLEDRLRLAREYNIAKAEAVALTDDAELKSLQGDLNSAMQSIEEALQRHGRTVYARTQRIYARILQARRKTAEAIEALEQGLAAARQRGAIEEQVLIGLDLALIHAENGDLVKARRQLDAAEAATSLDPALNLMARALYTRGMIHAKASQMNEANRCFSQSLSIFQTIGDPFRTALSHSAIGALRIGQNRLESARAHLEEAQRAFAKLGAMAELRRVEAKLTSTTLADVPAAMTTVLPAFSGTAQLSMAHKATTTLQTLHQPERQHILLAVASEELSAMMKRGLEVENYSVERVQDGREAFERATDQARSYHLMILDALLEHRSGFDVCRELRKKKRETPVILLGGRQGLEDKIEALQSGADDFLSKRNMVFEELLAKIEALLR